MLRADIMLIVCSGAALAAPYVPTRMLSSKSIAFAPFSTIPSALRRCPQPALRPAAFPGRESSDSALHGRPSRTARTARTARTRAGPRQKGKGKMQNSKILGTASCSSTTPAEVVAASFAEWLSLHDKEGLRSGKLRVLSVDMDGTIADTTARRRYAEEKAGVGDTPKKGVDNAPFFQVFLQGELYQMDSAIPGATDFLHAFTNPPTSGLVVYLSGRRAGTEGFSLEWNRRHGFPDGIILHRARGMRSDLFKADYLRAMKESPMVASVDAHAGDRERDDGGAAAEAGVPFIHIVHEILEGGPPPKPWPKFQESVCMR